MKSRKALALTAAWRMVAATLMIGMTILATSAQAADVYPSRLIRLVVPFPAGSATDVEARFLVDKVSALLNQKFVVENKAGANGKIGAAAVARRGADGNTR